MINNTEPLEDKQKGTKGGCQLYMKIYRKIMHKLFKKKYITNNYEEFINDLTYQEYKPKSK